MNWLSRIFGGRSEGEEYQDAPIAFPASTGDHTDAALGLPTFRPSRGRLLLSGGRPDARDARALIREAFTPSQPVSERSMFSGRRELLQQLIMAIEDQRLHFILYGDRGIGKTSILRLLSHLAGDAGYLVSYVSCGEGLTFSDLARRVGQQVPLLNHRGYAPGSPEIEQGLHLSDVLPAGTIDVSRFGEHLAKISDTQLVIMLDEFDRVKSDDFRASIAELIKNLSDNAAPAQVLIAGVASDLSGLIAQIPSIRRNVLGVLVPPMSENEVDEMLDRAEAKSGLSFPSDARELVVLASLGLPYLVGLVAQHASFISASRNELTVSKDDVRSAIKAARADMGGRVAAGTLHAIDMAAKRDELVDLGKLAHAALRSGGLLAPELLAQDIRQKEFASDPHQQLIEPIEGDPQQRWRFKDDGGAMYIWLTALTAR